MNTKQLALLGIILIVVLGAIALIFTGEPDEADQGPTACFASFEDYAIEEDDFFDGRAAAVDFSTNPDAEEFRSQITAGAAQGPNFAGRHTLITWECGEACTAAAIVNAQTGEIHTVDLRAEYGFKFKPYSNLLIVDPEELLPRIPGLLSEELQTRYLSLNQETQKLETVCEKGIAAEPLNQEQIVEDDKNDVFYYTLGSKFSIVLDRFLFPAEDNQLACDPEGAIGRINNPPQVEHPLGAAAYEALKPGRCTVFNRDWRVNILVINPI